MSFKWWKTITFTFPVGRREKHSISMTFNRVMNNVRVQCDGITIKRHIFIFTFGSHQRQIEFKVGKEEKHEVAIHFQLPNYFTPSLNPWEFPAFEDGKEIKKITA
jgi:hypothetical protein